MADARKLIAADATLDEAKLRDVQRELAGIKGGVERAGASAINKTLDRGRTVAVDELAGLLTVKRNNVLRRTGVAKATRQTLAGRIRILARRIGLINFENVETAKRGRRQLGIGRAQGVFARLYKGGPLRRYPHAFRATADSGNRHVMERWREGGQRVGRLPVFVRKGLSLLDVYRNTPAVLERTTDKIADEFHRQMDGQVDRLLKRTKTDG